MINHILTVSLLLFLIFTPCIAQTGESDTILAQTKQGQQRNSVLLKSAVYTPDCVSLALCSPYNNSVVNLRVSKTENSLLISFKFNENKTDWTYIDNPRGLHLLVRIFDEDGQYLTHFVTSESFTRFKDYYVDYKSRYDEIMAISKKNGAPLPQGMSELILLKNQTYNFEYPVNRRDIRDAAIVEVGFHFVR